MKNLGNRKSASNIKSLNQKPIPSENQDNEDICAICMGSYENMCHPNECFHKYCFSCLEEWTKIKPKCPYCQKKITSIIHSIRIDGTSKKYLLPQPSIYKQIKYFDGCWWLIATCCWLVVVGCYLLVGLFVTVP